MVIAVLLLRWDATASFTYPISTRNISSAASPWEKMTSPPEYFRVLASGPSFFEDSALLRYLTSSFFIKYLDLQECCRYGNVPSCFSLLNIDHVAIKSVFSATTAKRGLDESRQPNDQYHEESEQRGEAGLDRDPRRSRHQRTC